MVQAARDLRTDGGNFPAQPRRRWWLWVLIALAAAPVLLVCALLVVFRWLHPHAGPQHIRVSEETTYVTDFVDSRGRVDFLETVQLESSRGITSENNAVIPLLRAIGPPYHAQEICERLNIEILPEESPEYFVDFGNFIQKLYPETEEDESDYSDESVEEPAAEEKAVQLTPAAKIDERLSAAITQRDWNAFHQQLAAFIAERQSTAAETGFDQWEIQRETATRFPWRATDFPDLAAWLTANNAALDAVVEATRREKYYFPAARGETINDSYHVSVWLELRYVAEALCIRSMRHLGDGDVAQAWENPSAILRLSHLTRQGPNKMDAILSDNLVERATRSAAMLLYSDRLTPDLIAHVQRDLAALPPPSPLADKIDFGERLFLLESIITVAHKGANGYAGYPEGAAAQWQRVWDRQVVDWNNVLRMANAHFDGLVADLRLADPRQRHQAVQTRKNNIAQGAIRRLGSERLDFVGLLGGAPREEVILSALTIDLSFVCNEVEAVDSDVWAQASLANLQHALAIIAYRAKHGALPSSLAEVSPDDWKTRFADACSSGPLVYVLNGKDRGCFQVYSVGLNGLDDGGRTQDEAYLLAESAPEGQTVSTADYDLVLRVPPRFSASLIGLGE